MNVSTVCAIVEKFSDWASEVLTNDEVYMDMAEMHVACDAPGPSTAGAKVRIAAEFPVLDACFIFGFSTQS